MINQGNGTEIGGSGTIQDNLPNGINDTVTNFLNRAYKYLNSNVIYDESDDGNPENGKTDNCRFISWCVKKIRPSLKGCNHKDIFVRFNSAGYIRHRGLWKDIFNIYKLAILSYVRIT